MEERLYWLAFSKCNGVGPVKSNLLLRYFRNATTAWQADKNDLENSGVGKSCAEKIIRHRESFDPEVYQEYLQKLGVGFVILSDKCYPKLLKKIPNPPYVLFYKGNVSLLEKENLLAVVGTRKVTDYGREVTLSLTQELVQSGFVIVSGLALGVDALAHQATLDVKGKTIAVLGSGVDYCTPRENERLYERIINEDGLVISEAPPGQIPNKGAFPSRNRIIAGMSLGVLVTEGAEDSGSLITATYALDYERKVFAVPGPITSSVSRGPNVLIAKGAKMVTTAQDVLNELGRDSSLNKSRIEKKLQMDTKEEQKIVDLLLNQNMHFDELVKNSKFTTSLTGSLLSFLEVKGVVKHLGDGIYCLC